jgi:hypothetical protein
MEYSSGMAPEILKEAGLTNSDVELSIRLAYQLSEAVKVRRGALHEQGTLVVPNDAERERRERREQAEDDRIFLGAALFLAQRFKPKKKSK